MDVAVAGPDFCAAAVPSLKQFIREVTKSVPSPHGRHGLPAVASNRPRHERAPRHRTLRQQPGEEVHVGDLGSGSDFTPFLQHVGVPSTDIGSDGPYGVYHSAFDNYAWFMQNADPHFRLSAGDGARARP